MITCLLLGPTWQPKSHILEDISITFFLLTLSQTVCFWRVTDVKEEVSWCNAKGGGARSFRVLSKKASIKWRKEYFKFVDIALRQSNHSSHGRGEPSRKMLHLAMSCSFNSEVFLSGRPCRTCSASFSTRKGRQARSRPSKQLLKFRASAVGGQDCGCQDALG